MECMKALLLAFLGVLLRRREDVIVGVIDDQFKPILSTNVDVVAVLLTIVDNYDLWCLMLQALLQEFTLQSGV